MGKLSVFVLIGIIILLPCTFLIDSGNGETDMLDDELFIYSTEDFNYSILEDYVPYTGATGAVNLGVNDLSLTGDLKIAHLISYGDVDTFLDFMFADRIRFNAGAELLLDLFEGTQDYVKLGDGGDVDINLNDNIVIDGSTNVVAVGGNVNLNSYNLETTGTIITGDHGTATIDETVNVVYGTGSPPTASTTTIGTLFIKYTP